MSKSSRFVYLIDICLKNVVLFFFIDHRWSEFLLTNPDFPENYNRNSFFCDISRTYVNRAFICHPNYLNCSTSKNVTVYCSFVKKFAFKCDENQTIGFYQLCNHIPDCNDASDEDACGKILIIEISIKKHRLFR